MRYDIVMSNIILIGFGLLFLIFNKPLAIFNTELFKRFTKIFSKKISDKSKEVKLMYKFYRIIFVAIGFFLIVAGMIVQIRYILGHYS